MNILITGGTGLVDIRLSALFTEAGHYAAHVSRKLAPDVPGTWKVSTRRPTPPTKAVPATGPPTGFARRPRLPVRCVSQDGGVQLLHHHAGQIVFWSQRA